VALTKDRDYPSGAAAAYDTQENDLITKTRKIIAASKRAIRDAEAVLKRRKGILRSQQRGIRQ
jgi:hypothetical protein